MNRNIAIFLIGVVFFSCTQAPSIQIQKDPFSETTIYSLQNNTLIDNYPEIKVEFNLQKTITKSNSQYHIILNLYNSLKYNHFDSIKVIIDIDGNVFNLNPIYLKQIIKKNEFENNNIFKKLSYLLKYKNNEKIILPVSIQTLKQIAYGIDVKIKIEGNKKFLKAQLEIKNKINIQKFIESLVPFEEQVTSSNH